MHGYDRNPDGTYYYYEKFGRVTLKQTGEDLPIQQETYNTYDEARPGFYNVGQLTTAANDNAVIAYDYDAGGRRVQEAVTVDASTYVTVSAFDAGGRLLARVYPDSSSSGTFGYNSAGQQVSLTGAITATTYTAAGQVKTITYANGVTTTYTYSATRGWLDSAVTKLGTVTLSSATYAHDFASRITAVGRHTSPYCVGEATLPVRKLFCPSGYINVGR